MDFGGVVGMDGLVGSSSEGTCSLFSSPLVSSDNETGRHKGLFGSGFLKQGRAAESEEQEWRCLKMAKTGSFLMPPANATSAPSLFKPNTHSLFPDGQQMLSFSSPKQEALVFSSDGTLPYYHASSSSLSAAAAYVRSSGLNCGNISMNMHGTLAGVREPFTPSQWMELEHQAMIYKCFDANVPIPPSLLFSIRKSLNPSGYSAYSAGSLRPGAFGWGSFQLGFPSSTDPEPGRCRRTDGKKWRCSRDAVADQKYCERHLNRGRHRSRKPVEGHSGHAKAMPIIAPSSDSAVSGGGSSNCCTIAQQQIKSLQPASSSTQLNRIPINKDNVNDPQSLSLPTTMNPGLKDARFPILGQHNPFEEPPSRTEFGLSCTNSAFNPSRSSYLESRSFASSPDFKDQAHPFRQFIDEWPKNQSDRSSISWPEVEENPSDRTQLSMSCLEFSFPSPAQEKLNCSPLKPSQELDPIHMGLGVGGVLNDVNQRQASWVPISWETSMGGPLGEVLNSTCKDSINNTSSALNLLTSGWDSSPPRESSPTGVLQKAALCSLSSSTGSSPRVNYMSHESAGSLRGDPLGSTFLNSASFPSP